MIEEYILIVGKLIRKKSIRVFSLFPGRVQQVAQGPRPQNRAVFTCCRRHHLVEYENLKNVETFFLSFACSKLEFTTKNFEQEKEKKTGFHNFKVSPLPIISTLTKNWRQATRDRCPPLLNMELHPLKKKKKNVL